MRFVMIDKIIEWEVGKGAKGVKNISLSEDFFTDHFPKYPVMPGVLIIESLAQLSGLLLQETCKEKFGKDIDAIMSMVENMKFKTMARPGDTMNLEARVEMINEDGGKVSVKALINNKVIASGNLMFYFFPANDAISLQGKRNFIKFLREG